MKLLSQLVKFAKLLIASMNPPKPLTQEIDLMKAIETTATFTKNGQLC
jgi:hypothetical protein